MPRVEQKMPAAPSFAAGSTTTFKLPIGRRFHWLLLVCTGTAFVPADLQEIRILLNSKVTQRFSGAHRDMMNQFDGRAPASVTAGRFELIIPFDRYGILTKLGEEETAINTGSADKDNKSINAFSVEIDIASSGPTGTLNIDMFASLSESLPGGPGTVPFLVKSTRDFASATQYDISDLARGGVSTQFIDRFFLIPSTGTLDTFFVKANDYTLFERPAAINERAQIDGIRVPQPGLYVIDRTEHGYGGDPFDVRGLADFRLQLTPSAAMTLTLYTNYLGGLTD